MATETSSSTGSTLDKAGKLISVASLGVALFAAWKALPADAEIKQLQAETQRLDLALKKAEAELKTLESSRKLSFELYQEVKKVIEKKDKHEREEEAVRVLVESLAEEPFRYKLLAVLAVGARDGQVRDRAKASSTFYREELQLQQTPPAAVDVPAASSAAPGNTYALDLFYCDSRKALADRVLADKRAEDRGRWRLRALPESVNQQPGYGVIGNEIRYNAPEEAAIAKALRERLRSLGLDAQLREVGTPTPGYLSLFLCD